MRNKLAIGILLVALAGMAALGVYQIAVLHDFRPRTITGLLLSLTAGIITLIRVLSGHRHMSSRFYAREYGDILRTAFAQDRLSLMRFYKAIDLFNQNRPLKAVRQLEKLLKKCKTKEEYAAVYTFRGLNYNEAGCMYDAFAAFELAVQLDGRLSTAWSNLGLLYRNQGRNDKAVEAYEHAIAADAGNEFAHSNLAVSHLDDGRLDDCIREAEKALSLNHKLTPAMSSLAIAHHLKGDTEAADNYIRLYALNGGDGKMLSQRLEKMPAAASQPAAAHKPTEETIARLKATRQPVLRMTPTDAVPSIADSKLGGTPYLPRGGEYPCDPAGNPLRLLCQIDCRRCAGLTDFPQKGLLQFFILPSGSYGLDFDQPTLQTGFRVLYHPFVDPTVTETEVLSRMPVLPDDDCFPIREICGLQFSLSSELITREDYRFFESFRELTSISFDELNLDEADVINDKLNGSGLKMGGYPAFAQEDPRSEEDGAEYDTLLLQIDSEICGRQRIMWADSGGCHFFISRDNLRRLDFSDVLYHWDCG